MSSTDKIINHKTSLLNLAEELGNVSKACQTVGYSRDAVEESGVGLCFFVNRH